MTEPLITIELTTPEAVLFRQVQQYHDDFVLFNLLREKGVFNQRNAVMEIHFDNDGKVGAIHRHDIIYSKRHLSTEK